ncbi:MAG: GGDEF domain-containing protein [Chloroflexi bacterium]|nr:GGDEF domain-containing protein [Chloroflexota bacterium]
MEELTLHTTDGCDALTNLEQRELCLIPLLGTGVSGMRVLAQRETIIGRQPGVDLLVRDPRVSRQHCKIVLTNAGPKIVDLDSRNGTFVNDVQVKETYLNDSDLIRVGDTVFRLRYVDRVELERQEELYRRATRDSLTGLHNRQYLLERLNEELARARRHHFPVSFLMIDVDHFKLINDRLGHAAGDRALAVVAGILRDNVRSEDTVARYGGEEFAVLAPFSDVMGARILGERLRSLVERNDWSKGEGRMPLTISVGAATFPDDADAGLDLIHKSDIALYRAKHAGRNRVVNYSSNGEDTEK